LNTFFSLLFCTWRGGNIFNKLFTLYGLGTDVNDHSCSLLPWFVNLCQ